MRVLSVAVVAITVLGCGGRANDIPPPLPPGVQPNIVWIVLDAARAENFSWHGYDRETTPFIDGLTNEGAAFNRHYAQAPATLYSISSYLSGRYFATSYHDDVGMQSAFRVRPDGERLVSEIAARNGYHTAAFSTSPWFYETSPLAQTFDEFVVGRADDGTMEPFDAMAGRVETWLESKPHAPFFLYVHAMDTHFPHTVNPDVAQWYPRGLTEDRADALRRGKAPPPFDDEDRAYLRALYDGGLRQADNAVKRLCEALKDAGVWNRTILVISSDHGELLGEDGRTIQHPIQETQHALFQTPLVLRGPGIAPNVRVDALTENVDILPTIADLAAWDVDAELEGFSLRPLWSEEDAWTPRPYAVGRSMCFAPFGKPSIVLVNQTHQFVHALCSGNVSGHAILNGAAAVSEDQLSASSVFVNERVLPRWDAFAALPQIAPPVQQRAFPNTAKPTSAYTGEQSDADGRWTLVDGVLREGGTAEDVPAIHLAVPVHAGSYRIIIEAEAEAASDTVRSLQFKEETEKAFRTIPIPDTGAAIVGEYAITTDTFRFVIDDTLESAPLTLFAIRFERPTQAGTEESVTPAEERLDTLRSLGYVD